MNKILKIIVLFILSAMFTENIVADSNSITTILYMNSNVVPCYKIDDDSTGKRSPALTGTLSKERGLEINGLSDEIISYEIWDTSGSVCIGYFTDEEEFVEYLFSLNGEFRIILFYSDYILTGEVSLR